MASRRSRTAPRHPRSSARVAALGVGRVFLLASRCRVGCARAAWRLGAACPAGRRGRLIRRRPRARQSKRRASRAGQARCVYLCVYVCGARHAACGRGVCRLCLGTQTRWRPRVPRSVSPALVGLSGLCVFPPPRPRVDARPTSDSLAGERAAEAAGAGATRAEAGEGEREARPGARSADAPAPQRHLIRVTPCSASPPRPFSGPTLPNRSVRHACPCVFSQLLRSKMHSADARAPPPSPAQTPTPPSPRVPDPPAPADPALALPALAAGDPAGASLWTRWSSWWRADSADSPPPGPTPRLPPEPAPAVARPTRSPRPEAGGDALAAAAGVGPGTGPPQTPRAQAQTTAALLALLRCARGRGGVQQVCARGAGAGYSRCVRACCGRPTRNALWRGRGAGRVIRAVQQSHRHASTGLVCVVEHWFNDGRLLRGPCPRMRCGASVA